ncbi:MAG: PhoH family protein [Candidatus Omnitrophica bacterium]|nr:PhoH family protein [Candidatus Omnitrophota bacterium]
MKEYIEVRKYHNLQQLFGPLDRNIKIIEQSFDIDIYVVDNKLCLEGKRQDLKMAKRVVEDIMKKGENSDDILGIDVAEMVEEYKAGKEKEEFDRIKILSARSQISPRSFNQQKYVDSIKKYDLVFAIGPAGSGKTYLAMAMALNFLQRKMVKRIIMTRPAIEAGESLGYLPGGIQQKLNPYLRPLYDALYDILEGNVADDYLKSGIIEVAPLAYMRGRTLNGAFIILDEAQNCTQQQLKMFLTRFGQGSKVVVTGDITQTDLPQRRPVGFISTLNILKRVNGIEFVYLDSGDIVRHSLVRKITEAYEKHKRSKTT